MELKPELEKYGKLVYDNLRKCTDIEITIVKGHILIEHHINRFILASIKQEGYFEETKFTFSQKVKLAFMLGLISDLEDDLILINKLRNEIAHKLTFTDDSLEALILRTEHRLPIEAHKIGISKLESLKRCIGFICGALYAAVGINRPEFLKILDDELEK